MNKLILSVLLLGMGQAAHAACLQTPIPGTIITSNFGARFHPVLQIWRNHNGTDFRAAMNTRVQSAQSGQVQFAGWSGGGGNTVYILGSDGTQTRYLHLTKATIQPGDIVQAGQVIGLSGNTGHASAAPHLHMEVRPAPGSTPVDARSRMCEQLAEKAGAGPETSGGGEQAPQVAGGGSASSVPPSAPVRDWTGMSTLQIMRTEVERRFLNPDWQMQISTCSGDASLVGTGNMDLAANPQQPNVVDCKTHLWRELAYMKAFSNWMEFMKTERREEILALLAASYATRAKVQSAAELQVERENAAGKAGRMK